MNSTSMRLIMKTSKVRFLPSVTIFGEISPLRHNFKNLGHIFEGLFSVWQNFDPILAKKFTLGQVFIAVDGQIL